MTSGTQGYISPEQLENDGSFHFDLTKCDVFALGVFLFILVRGYAPFKQPSKHDKYYSAISRRQPVEFWKLHQGRRGSGMLSRELKNLIADMIAVHPDERPDIQAIRNYPWMRKNEFLSAKMVKRMMEERNAQ